MGGVPGRALYDSNLWVLMHETDDQLPFDQQIPAFLDSFGDSLNELPKLLSEDSTGGDLFLGFFANGGQGFASLSHSILKRIVALKLSVEVDLYPPSVPEP